jgi:hypothetical protein
MGAYRVHFKAKFKHFLIYNLFKLLNFISKSYSAKPIPELSFKNHSPSWSLLLVFLIPHSVFAKDYRLTSEHVSPLFSHSQHPGDTKSELSPVQLRCLLFFFIPRIKLLITKPMFSSTDPAQTAQETVSFIPTTGFRKYNLALIGLPKQNGQSSIAGITLF